MKPTVSVVMSVYNGERYLREAVDSILNQTFTDFEFIIVNDGSTDRTREILESYADERIVLVHQENTGLTRALNNGIALAKGKYIARQDADDVSRPERLEKQVAFMEANPQVGLLGTRFEFIDENGNVVRAAYIPLENKVIQERLIEINQFCHGSALIRKEALDRVGVFREFFRLAQDYDLWLRISEQFEVANLPDLLCLYRELATAISSDKILLQSRYAGAAVEMARQRRETGTDEIMQGKEPMLPPASRFSRSLQRKLSIFYSQNPEKMLAGLEVKSKDSDLAFLFELICNERLQYEEELRQKNEQLRQSSENLGKKDAQIRTMYSELEQAKQRQEMAAERQGILDVKVAKVFSETSQTHEILARISEKIERDLQQKNEQLAELERKYDEKCHEVITKDQEIVWLEEESLKRQEMSGTLCELEQRFNEKCNELLVKEQQILEKDQELVLLSEERSRERKRLEEEISRQDELLSAKEGLFRQKTDELLGKEKELQAKCREIADREQEIRLLNERAAAEKLSVEEELAQKDKLLGEKLDLLKRVYEDLQKKDNLLDASQKELSELGERAAAEKLHLETEIAQRDRLIEEKAESISQLDVQLKGKAAEISDRDERIGQFETAVATAGQRLEEHRRSSDAQLALLNEKLQSMEQQLQQKDRALRELEAKLQVKSDGLRELEEELAHVKGEKAAERRDYEQRINEKERTIEELLNSKSWRITAPLRKAVKIFQKK